MHASDVLVSLAGVLLIVGLVRWAMGNAIARIGEDAAKARIALEHPDFEIDRLVIGTDGHDALALSADGREVILLFAMGDRITCWRMPRLQIRAEATGDPTKPTLELTTGEYTLPRLRLACADAAVGHELVSLLGREARP
jgi:hypothetical protein